MQGLRRPLHRRVRDLRRRGAHRGLRQGAAGAHPRRQLRLHAHRRGQEHPPHPRDGPPERGEEVLHRPEGVQGLHARPHPRLRPLHHHPADPGPVPGQRRLRHDEGQAHPHRGRRDLHRREPPRPGGAGAGGRGHRHRPGRHPGGGRRPEAPRHHLPGPPAGVQRRGAGEGIPIIFGAKRRGAYAPRRIFLEQVEAAVNRRSPP